MNRPATSGWAVLVVIKRRLGILRAGAIGERADGKLVDKMHCLALRDQLK